MTIYRYAAEAIYPSGKPRILTIEAKSIDEARALARGRLRMTYARLGRVTNVGKARTETARVDGYRILTVPGADVGVVSARSNRTGEVLELELDRADYDAAVAAVNAMADHDVEVDPVRVLLRRRLTLGDYGHNND